MIPGAVRGDGISCQTSNWCVKHGDTGLVVICRIAFVRSNNTLGEPPFSINSFNVLFYILPT